MLNLLQGYLTGQPNDAVFLIGEFINMLLCKYKETNSKPCCLSCTFLNLHYELLLQGQWKKEYRNYKKIHSEPSQLSVHVVKQDKRITCQNSHPVAIGSCTAIHQVEQIRNMKQEKAVSESLAWMKQSTLKNHLIFGSRRSDPIAEPA